MEILRQRGSHQSTNQATRDQLNQHDVNRKMSQLLETSNNARMETLPQINDARAEAAKCCCETKLLVTTENNATRTLLLEQRIAQQENSANAAGQVAILQAINNLAASISGHGRD